MKKSKQIIVEVECCDKCGEELYFYDEQGRPPRYITGVYWTGDESYCERTCIPE
jgi:hypothetical protein